MNSNDSDVGNADVIRCAKNLTNNNSQRNLWHGTKNRKNNFNTDWHRKFRPRTELCSVGLIM